jgi:hypothetical protein
VNRDVCHICSHWTDNHSYERGCPVRGCDCHMTIRMMEAEQEDFLDVQEIASRGSFGTDETHLTERREEWNFLFEEEEEADA